MKPSRYELECALDDALLENEDLRAKVEELEELAYRLRTSERQVRQSALFPAEMVTLYTWVRIDKIHDRFAPYEWKKREDFPAPVSANHIAPLYDIADLRAWREANEKRIEARKVEALKERAEQRLFIRQFYKTECYE